MRNHRTRFALGTGALSVMACSARAGDSALTADAACAVPATRVAAEFTPVLPDSTLVRFAGVTRAEVRANGDLVVLDGTGPVLFRVDTSGRTAVLADKAGSGPGDLMDPRAFAFDSRSHLWIVGPNPPALSEFDSTGRFIRSYPYWRSAMVTDAAFDQRDQLYLAYRLLNPAGRLAEGESFATIEQLRLGDTVTAIVVDSLTRTTLAGAPYFNAPLVDFALAPSGSGMVVATPVLAYQLHWLGDEARAGYFSAGCQDSVNNEARLKSSTILDGGYTLITHDMAAAPDGSLYHLTANVRQDGTQRLDRFRPDGTLAEALLIPSRRTGGAYLSALLPTPDSTLFWGYETGGAIYRVKIR